MPLDQAFDEYAVGRPKADKRSFFAGALAVLADATATREQLLAEVLQFGRTIGTAAERIEPAEPRTT